MSDTVPPSILRAERASQSKRPPRVPYADLIPALASRMLGHKPPSAKIAETPEVLMDTMKLIRDVAPRARSINPKLLDELLENYQTLQKEHEKLQLYRKNGILDKAVNHRWSNLELDRFVTRVMELHHDTKISTNTIDLELARSMQAGLLSNTPQLEHHPIVNNASPNVLHSGFPPDTPRLPHFADDQGLGFSNAYSSQHDTPRLEAHFPTANDQGNTPQQACYRLTESESRDPSFSFLQATLSPATGNAGSDSESRASDANGIHWHCANTWPDIEMKWPRNPPQVKY